MEELIDNAYENLGAMSNTVVELYIRELPLTDIPPINRDKFLHEGSRFTASVCTGSLILKAPDLADTVITLKLGRSARISMAPKSAALLLRVKEVSIDQQVTQRWRLMKGCYVSIIVAP